MSFLLSVQPFCSLRFFEVIIPYATDENKKTSLVLLVDKRGFFDGPSDRIRTCGIVVPNHARYQLRYTRICCFSACSLYTMFLPGASAFWRRGARGKKRQSGRSVPNRAVPFDKVDGVLYNAYTC